MKKDSSFVYKLVNWFFGSEESSDIAEKPENKESSADTKEFIMWVNNATKERDELLEEIRNETEEIELSREFSEPDKIKTAKFGLLHLHGKFDHVSTGFTNNRLRVTEAIIRDDTGTLKAVWFGSNVSGLIKRDVEYEIRGKLELKNQRIQLSGPKFRPLKFGCIQTDLKETATKPKTVNDNFSQSNKWDNEITGRQLSKDSKWYKNKAKVLARDNYTCVICGVKNKNLTVDHIIPLSLEGKNILSNMQTLCKDCHEDKHFRKFLDRGFDADDNYGENYNVSKKIKIINNAIENDLSLKIVYEKDNGETTHRTIHPALLRKGVVINGEVVNHQAIYLKAFCDLRNDNRTFRVSRITIK